VGDDIDALIEDVIVDAYNDSEQLWSFRQAFEDTLRFPFRATVVGADVTVTQVDFDGDERRGLVARCQRAGESYMVSLIDITPAGPLPLETSQLIDAYRRWAGATALPTTDTQPATRWVSPRFGAADIDIEVPLELAPRVEWNPATEYWGEPGDPLHPLCQAAIAAGPRPCFEMEQVIPGADDDDWDSDPIVEAADLHHAGQHRAAIRLLEAELAADVRCIDAWGHLGLIAFDTRGPGPAAELYRSGIAVAEASLQAGFGGVLPWGMIDNRPLLRCLHGLGLCAWRQRRWDDAEEIFTARVWLDPAGAFNDLACLELVQARMRWTTG
jgi:Calcium binding